MSYKVTNIVLSVLSCLITVVSYPHYVQHREAVCYVNRNTESDDTLNNVYGIVWLYQEKYGIDTFGPLQFVINIQGFEPKATSLHGFHAHTSANFTKGCDSTGGHYNPFNVDHGAPGDNVRHVGDFGNLQARYGQVSTIYLDYFANIFDGCKKSIMGRPLVIHAGVDDLGRGGNAGSRASGNAGKRIACCQIQKPRYPVRKYNSGRW